MVCAKAGQRKARRGPQALGKAWASVVLGEFEVWVCRKAPFRTPQIWKTLCREAPFPQIGKSTENEKRAVSA